MLIGYLGYSVTGETYLFKDGATKMIQYNGYNGYVKQDEIIGRNDVI
jgi:hypothetical protein